MPQLLFNSKQKHFFLYSFMDFFLLTNVKLTIENCKYPMFHVHVHRTCMHIGLSHF